MHQKLLKDNLVKLGKIANSLRHKQRRDKTTTAIIGFGDILPHCSHKVMLKWKLLFLEFIFMHWPEILQLKKYSEQAMIDGDIAECLGETVRIERERINISLKIFLVQNVFTNQRKIVPIIAYI